MDKQWVLSSLLWKTKALLLREVHGYKQKQPTHSMPLATTPLRLVDMDVIMQKD